VAGPHVMVSRYAILVSWFQTHSGCSKSNLQAPPIYYRKRDSIDAFLASPAPSLP
jgi:hypothetical protein